MSISKFTADQDRERLATLCGERGDRRQAAIRIDDLTGILQLPAIQAKQITAAPTVDQYNTLLRDVQNVATALDAVSKALQRKLRP